MKINTHGYWEQIVGHHTDVGLYHFLPTLFKDQTSIVDFGCGDATYAKRLLQNSPEKNIKAFDGNPYVKEITDGFASQLDLSQNFNLGEKFDVVMSLEVAEHIPKEYEETYINNLINHTNNYLLISWAIPGQGGKGHVNEQDNEYVKQLFNGKGFKYNEGVSNLLRNCIQNCTWFKNTIFLFESNG